MYKERQRDREREREMKNPTSIQGILASELLYLMLMAARIGLQLLPGLACVPATWLLLANKPTLGLKPICVRIHIQVYIYICIIYIHICTYITYTYTYTYAYMHTYIHTYVDGAARVWAVGWL